MKTLILALVTTLALTTGLQANAKSCRKIKTDFIAQMEEALKEDKAAGAKTVDEAEDFKGVMARMTMEMDANGCSMQYDPKDTRAKVILEKYFPGSTK